MESEAQHAQPKEAVQTVASYRNGDEAIVIQQYPNGQFYNHYGYDEQGRSAMATAGGFASLEEAEAALRSHRPMAEKVMETAEKAPAEPIPDAGPTYQVGDTVYLEDTPYVVEEHLAMTVYDGWERLDIRHSQGTNPDSERSIIVYGATARRKLYKMVPIS